MSKTKTAAVREREREKTRQTKKREEKLFLFNVGKERRRINCIIWNTHISKTRKTTPPGPPFGSAAPSGASVAAAAGTEAKPKA